MLWLWHRLAAIAPITPLAQEPPYAAGEALEKVKRHTHTHTHTHTHKLSIGVPNVVQKDQQCLCGGRDMGSIPGLVQWVKGLMLL